MLVSFAKINHVWTISSRVLILCPCLFEFDQNSILDDNQTIGEYWRLVECQLVLPRLIMFEQFQVAWNINQVMNNTHLPATWEFDNRYILQLMTENQYLENILVFPFHNSHHMFFAQQFLHRFKRYSRQIFLVLLRFFSGLFF